MPKDVAMNMIITINEKRKRTKMFRKGLFVFIMAFVSSIIRIIQFQVSKTAKSVPWIRILKNLHACNETVYRLSVIHFSDILGINIKIQNSTIHAEIFK